MSVLGTGKSHHQVPVSDQELGCQPAQRYLQVLWNKLEPSLLRESVRTPQRDENSSRTSFMPGEILRQVMIKHQCFNRACGTRLFS